MPKRILLPVLITTGFLSLGAGTFVATPLITRAQDNNKNQNSQSNESTKFVDDKTNWYGAGMMHFMGKKMRSNDLAYAKSLGVDTTKAEDAQSKVKDAEDNLRTEIENVRESIRNAIIKKAEENKVDQKIIDDYKTSFQKLADERKALEDALSKPESTMQTIKDLREKVRDNMKNYKLAEKAIKDAIQ